MREAEILSYNMGILVKNKIIKIYEANIPHRKMVLKNKNE